MRGVDDEHVDARRRRAPAARSIASGPTPTAAPTRSRPSASFVACGNWARLEMSLTVISPRRQPSASTTGSFSILCRWRISSASSSVVPTGAVTRLRAVISAETGCVVSSSKRRSRFVRMPTRRPSPSVIGHAGDVVAGHQLERGGDGRVGAQRDGLGDHPGLGALHPVDLGDLLLDREVAVEDADSALAGQRDGQPRLGDRVHRGRDDRDLRARSPRVSRVAVDTSLGSTADAAGTSSTSSNVSPSCANFRSSASSRSSSSGRSSTAILPP